MAHKKSLMITTLLIVDDRADNRAVLIAVLAHGDYRLLEAESGTQALRIARKERPDLIITDVLMAKIDGYEFVRQLRKDPKIAHVTVIFYTASYIEEEARSLAKACGVHHVIVKPAAPEEVLRVVASALATSAPTTMELPPAEFGREHLRLVTNKLSEKVAALNDLNAQLEQRVAERTSELEAVNRELEVFSYSVSHDLRAPVRAMNGFSQTVLEDYGDLLPEEGRHDLESIREGAKEMGALIDHLLALSRLTRTQLKRRKVDTRKLVEDVIAELSPDQKDRKIDIKTGDIPPCQGDATLLKQVWINLLSNALKYTRKRERAVVEIGCNSNNGENVYFVRDNGTGFDMRYADKLFGVFQRLHRAEEYEGTGVGLAIVERIIHRHGGRVWANAVENEGATFYFTVGGATES